MMSAAAFNSAARSSGAVRLHAGNAVAAAPAADSTSSTVDSGASPTTCSVAGFTISYVDMVQRLERVLVLGHAGHPPHHLGRRPRGRAAGSVDGAHHRQVRRS